MSSTASYDSRNFQENGINWESVTPTQVFESKSFYIRFFPDNYAELIIKADILFNEQIAKHAKKVLELQNPGIKYYLYSEPEGFFRVTRKARKLGAMKEFSNHLAAVAFVTSNSSLALLGELYNKINKPAVPTKVFSSKDSAREWLFDSMRNAD